MWFVMNNINLHSIKWELIIFINIRVFFATDHTFYKFFSNSLLIHHSSSNKTKKVTTMKEVWILVFIIIDFDDLLLRLCLTFVSIEKIYQTLKTVFHGLSKRLEFRQQYSAVHHTF